MKKRNKKICIFIILLLMICTACGNNTEIGGKVSAEIEKLDDIYVDEAFEQENENADQSEDLVEVLLDEKDAEKIYAEAAKEEQASISLVMVGDILLHTPIEKNAQKEDGSYDFSPLFQNLKEEIQQADIAMVNQEVIIGGEELGISGYPAFNAPFAISDSLVDAGFDVILHATNHAVDKGKKGLVNCMNNWDNCYPNIVYLGIHNSETDQNSIYYYEQEGIRVAILNYTYGTNGIALPGDMPWGVDLLDRQKVEQDIKLAEENADFTIVCPHWGTEYNLGISAEQKKWAEIMVSHGADLIIGTHPHVIEPVEWYEAENGNRALIYYSLGNYVNWTSGTGAGTANRMVGGMAEVTLTKDGEKVYINDYGVRALVSHVESEPGKVTTYPLSEYNQELAEMNEIGLQDGNFSYEYCVNLCNDIWDEWR